MKLNEKEIYFLINCSQWMFDDGMVNFTKEDYDEFERIQKKWGNENIKEQE